MSAAFTAREPVPAPPPLTGVVQRKAEQAGPGCARDLPQVTSRPGTTLDPALGAELGTRFGIDFSRVRVHADPAAAASAVRLHAAAYTVGPDIVFGPGRFAPHTAEGRRLLAHELAHVAQQGVATAAPGPVRVSAPSDAQEVEAERAADTVLAGGSPRLTARAHGPTVFRQVVDPFAVLSTAKPLTAAEAKSLLDAYEALPSADRDTFVRRHHTVGVLGGSGVARLLAGLAPAELKSRRALVSDIQERVQRITVETTAGRTLVQLGATQGAFMKAEAEKLARAKAAEDAKRAGVPEPTTVSPADVAAAHDRETRRTSPVIATVTNAWDALSPAAQATWNTRAAAVITKVVDACNRKDAALGITAANLKWAPRDIAQSGSNVFATSGDPIEFGMAFVETAEADPDYVVRTVVHEIAGHPDFGSRFGSYEAKIYAEAHTQEPTLGLPWDTHEEKSTYAYIGTETYAAMREVPFETPLSAADATRGLRRAIDPASNIDNKIGLIKSKYAPGVAEAVLQGLYERFRVDPRISDDALALFERLADKHFGKVLKGVPKRGPTYTFEPAAGIGLEQAGGRSRLFTTVEANIGVRWANTALSAGVRLEVPLDTKDTFVRVGGQAGIHQRLFRSLYGELRGGYVHGFGGASSGATVGAGLSYDFGPAQLGLVYDYLKASADKDPDAHRTFLRLGLRF